MDLSSLTASPLDSAVLMDDVTDIFNSIGAVAYRWDISTDRLTWGANAACILNIADIKTAVGTGRAFAQLSTGGAQSRHDVVMNSPLADSGSGIPYQTQYALSLGKGMAPIWVEDIGRWFGGPDGRPRQAQGIIRVINELDGKDDRPAFQFDDLTGEKNRRSLTDILNATLENAIKSRLSIGFLVVSVDDLARVNDAYGFAIGDEVIAALAKRLRARMRAGDHLGRISGNKFGIVLVKCEFEDLRNASDRLLEAATHDAISTTIGPLTITASIGGIIAPRHAHSVRDILSLSQEALNAGKRRQRGSVEIYRPDSKRDALRRENIRATDEIIGALNERRVVAAFEPIVEARSRRVVFYECLLRVKHSDGSLAVANDILPIAERLGLVRMVDHRMLELAMDEMKAAPDLCLSLNVSPSSINDAMYWNAMTAALAGDPGIAKRLIVEITELTAISDVEVACELVNRLKDLGCRIAIDDFGAGYTSFRNIRRLSVDIVKIDGSYVKNLPESPDDQAFVRTLIELARKLRLATVAEWVQDEATANLLADWGCDYLQGSLTGMAEIDPPWRSASADIALAQQG